MPRSLFYSRLGTYASDVGLAAKAVVAECSSKVRQQKSGASARAAAKLLRTMRDIETRRAGCCDPVIRTRGACKAVARRRALLRHRRSIELCALRVLPYRRNTRSGAKGISNATRGAAKLECGAHT